MIERTFFEMNISILGIDKINTAKNFAKNVVRETYDRFSYSTNRRIETIYIGKLAEEVFKKFAKDEFDINLDINYDIYHGTTNVDINDFKINKFEIDIKSSKDTKNEGIMNCYRRFNFPVPTDQDVKDITISILYDYLVENFFIVSWIDKETYLKNAEIRELPVGNGVYKEFYLYPLRNGRNIYELKTHLFPIR